MINLHSLDRNSPVQMPNGETPHHQKSTKQPQKNHNEPPKNIRAEGHALTRALKKPRQRRYRSAEGRSEDLSEVEGRND
jgi:hypothetical protein